MGSGELTGFPNTESEGADFKGATHDCQAPVPHNARIWVKDILVNCLVLYCRSGFEKECAAEISARAAASGASGYARVEAGSGYVIYHLYAPHPSELAMRLPWRMLVFARQIFVARQLSDLPLTDRVTPIVDALSEVGTAFEEVFVETADTNEAKEVQTLCRKITPPLRAALQARGLWGSGTHRRAHVMFLDWTCAYVGYADVRQAAPWPMGIPRLRFPREAPSRSTLKLEEALLVFLTREERERRLRAGGTAVDLGAAPGGWTWQFVRRHMQVVAVDNGPMASNLLDSGLVQHVRADGFTYEPRKPVDWMACDMVEQPRRIAALVARWIARGWAAEAIFNLKLPMKKRYDEVLLCEESIRAELSAASARYALAFKQLYHDREEITGHLRRI